MATTNDLSNWTTLAIVDRLAAINDELIARDRSQRHRRRVGRRQYRGVAHVRDC
jgi:hypothetical protein